MVRAVTFDLWDTLVVDDSDEEVRKARGLPTKVEARRTLFVDDVLRWHDGLESSAVNAAFDAANERFRHSWKVEHRTPHIRERLTWALDELGLAPTPTFDDVVRAFATMEVEIPPRACDGVHAMLEALHGRFPLAIISDAIVTPGSELRNLLARHDLLRFFDVFVFSDEVGASKPDPKVFHAAADGLGVPVTSIVHVGDREANDIAGPIGVGARGILYTGAIDRGSDTTKAAAVCRHLDALPGIVDALHRGGAT